MQASVLGMGSIPKPDLTKAFQPEKTGGLSLEPSPASEWIFFPLWVPPPPMGYMRCRWHSEVFLGLRLEKWSRKDWSKVYFCILPINFVAEKGVSQEFWVYFYRKRVALVSCLLSFLFWLTLSPHLFSVPLEESGELSLFPVLIKVTCSLPRSPHSPGSNR